METVTKEYQVSNPERIKKINTLQTKLLSSFKFRFFLIWKMPIAWLAGMRLLELDSKHCVTSIPYKWLSQNPFRSTYFATQSMAAELSNGAISLLAVRSFPQNVSMLVVGMQAKFLKKADQTVYFTCDQGDKIFQAVDECIRTGEGSTVKVDAIGKTADGTLISEFSFTWSFKAKKQ